MAETPKKELVIAGSRVVKSFAELRKEQIKTIKQESKEADDIVSEVDAEIKHEAALEERATNALILAKLNNLAVSKPDNNYKTICKNNLERFQFLCKDYCSPDLFIDFDFYFMVSACLARKVWWGTNNAFVGNLYPNLYLVFVTPPGIGKSLPANTAGRILNKLIDFIYDEKIKKFIPRPMLNLGPDCITFEKLLIRSALANYIEPWPDGPMKYYHHCSTTFCLGDELGMLLTSDTKRIVSFLMKAWDCGDVENDTKQDGVTKIANVCFNFLGCTTPLIMKDLVRTRVLDNGFTGRAIFLYADKKRKKIKSDLTESPEQRSEINILIAHLKKLVKLTPTNVKFSPEAAAWFEHWVDHKEDIRLNPSIRLDDYYARKAAQLKKLAVCHHYANGMDNIITVEDFQAAEALLLRAEPMMHKALVQQGENFTYVLSENIITYLRICKAADRKKILVDFFNVANQEQLNMALSYLIDTGQVRTEKHSDGKMMVKYVEPNNF